MEQQKTCYRNNIGKNNIVESIRENFNIAIAILVKNEIIAHFRYIDTLLKKNFDGNLF